MKKAICISLIFVTLLCCLTGCNFTSNTSGALAGEAKSTEKAEEMMAALAENRISDAKALMHPQIADRTDAALSQISSYLSGRSVNALEQQNINVSTSSGSGGSIRQEQVIYKATLSDSTVVYLNAVYVSGSEGSGFASFQLVLGAI